MATNSIPVLREATRITLLADGEIVEEGSYQEVMSSKTAIYNIIRHLKDSRTSDDDETSTLIATSSSSASASVEESEASEDDSTFIKAPKNGKKHRRQSAATLRRASDASFSNNRKIVLADETQKRTNQSKEFLEQGKVKWDVYTAYAKVANLPAVTAYGLALASAQTAQILGNFWLKHWAESNADAGRNDNIGKYLGIYFALGIGATALIMIQNIVLYIWCAIRVRFLDLSW